MDLEFRGERKLGHWRSRGIYCNPWGHSMNSSARFVAQAIDDPARYYRRPSQVVRDRRLDDREKLAILEAWELEAREFAMAEEAGPDDEPTLLQDIMQARGELGA